VQIGTLRSKGDTLSELRAQLNKVLEGAPTSAGTMARASGVKDRYALHFFDQLQEICQKVKHNDSDDSVSSATAKQSLQQLLAQARQHMPAGDAIINPAFSIDGKSGSVIHRIAQAHRSKDLTQTRTPHAKFCMWCCLGSLSTSGVTPFHGWTPENANWWYSGSIALTPKRLDWHGCKASSLSSTLAP
jgi:hypothetical protein